MMLVRTQVSAVSAKTNTTGAARLGAFTEDDCQVALYDTPGVVHTRYPPSAGSAWQSILCIDNFTDVRNCSPPDTLCSLTLQCNIPFCYRHSLCSLIGFIDACRFLHGPRHAKSVRSAWVTASSCELLMCIVDARRQVLCAPMDGVFSSLHTQSCCNIG